MNYEDKIVNMCEEAHVIFIYISKEGEVETRGIIKSFLQSGKRVVVPVCVTETKVIIPSEIDSLDDCSESTYGICEPDSIREVPKEEIDVFIVPGTMFDVRGNRKGRGMGYFDRFLSNIKGTKKIYGLCFKSQLVDSLNTEAWDIPVDEVIIAD